MRQGKSLRLLAVTITLLIPLMAQQAFASGVLNSACGYEGAEECDGDIGGMPCKEFKCLDDVCKIATKLNCCPNEMCEQNENYGNCPGDCPPQNISFEVLSPASGTEYMRGDDVLLKVSALADGRAIASADINVSGVLGDIDFYNDGRHDDELLGDNVYANTAKIGRGVAEGMHVLKLSASFMNIAAEGELAIVVNPKIEATLTLAESLMLGQMVNISGMASKKGRGANMWLDVNISSKGKGIFYERVQSDSGGRFSAAYHTSLLDPEGEWLVHIYGEDMNGNYVLVEKKINVTSPSKILPIEVKLLSRVEEFYRRGDTMNMVAKIFADGKSANGAKAEVFWGGNKTGMEELLEGQYSASIDMPYSTPLGAVDFRIVASYFDQNIAYKGATEFRTTVDKAILNVRIIKPERRSFKVGEEIEILAEVSYPTEELVTNAEVKALVGEKEVELQPVTKGAFSATFVPKEEDAGSKKVFVGANDEFGNAGYNSRMVEIAGKSGEYYVAQYGALIGALVVIGIGVLVYAYVKNTGKKSIEALLHKENDVAEKLAGLQDQYFKQHGISQDGYRELRAKYEMELDNVRKSVEQVKKKVEGRGK